MKKFKYIISSLLVAFVLCVPFIVVGCAKYGTVTISIASGKGNVVKTNSVTSVSKSLIGENDVELGTDFSFTVTPQTHYQIKYVKVNGEYIYHITEKTDLYTPDEHGEIRPCITINKKTTIEVAFETVPYYTATIYYNASEEEGSQNWALLKNTDDIQVTLEFAYGYGYYFSAASQYSSVVIYYKDGEEYKQWVKAGENFNLADTYFLSENINLYFDCNANDALALVDSFTEATAE